MLFDGELHGFYDKVHSAVDANCIVVGEEMISESFSKSKSYVGSQDSSNCCWNSDWS